MSISTGKMFTEATKKTTNYTAYIREIPTL